MHILDIRGNVDTRVRKTLDPTGPYTATVLAQAGLERLALDAGRPAVLGLDVMLPAPGQGALAVQCRDDAPSLDVLAPLDHRPTRAAVYAERAFLAGLGGGCAVPVAALATIRAETLHLQGRVLSMDGRACIHVEIAGPPDEAEELGQALAREALAQGAAHLLAT